MSCWKCVKQIKDRITFRSRCETCETDTHVCKNCRYYSPGKPNDCIVPGIEKVTDPEKANFCEEFKVKTFISGNEEKLKNTFNNLFK